MTTMHFMKCHLFRWASRYHLNSFV